MNITHLSVSRKQLWDECPQKYKYKYHLKLVNEQEEPFYFIYGTIIHKIAQEYVNGEGNLLISEVANDVLSGKIEMKEGKKAPPLPQEYKRKMPSHLGAIKKLTEQTGFGGKLEYDFRYDLDPPNKREIIGFIDRLIIKDDKAWILDYKTTKQGWWRKTKKDIVNDLQLRCYARIVQKKFNIKAENIKTALYYLEGGDLVGAKFSEKSLDAVEKELLETYKAIETSNPDQVWGNVTNNCKRCEYNKLCPFYSLT